MSESDCKIKQIVSGIDGGGQAQPMFASTVPAGFPSPADDYVEQKLDLNDLLIKHPSATFFARVSGNSMIGEGIHDNDLVVVDRSISPQSNNVVIAVLEGELTIKRLIKQKNKILLMSANPQFKPIEITDEREISFWGVVTAVIHCL